MLPGADLGSETEEKPKGNWRQRQRGQHEVSVSVFEESHCEPEKLKGQPPSMLCLTVCQEPGSHGRWSGER